MKILITGATGFIGANLIQHFSKKGHHIIGLSRSQQPPKRLKEYAEHICADISESVPQINCDAVIHAAALANDRSGFSILKKVNVDGTKRVYEATPNANLFIHISSSSVYHFDGTNHSENKPIISKKLSLYGKSKFMAEKCLLGLNDHKKSIVILRPRAVYGIGDRVLLPRILNLPKKEKVYFPGSQNIETSMTHVKNLAYAIEFIFNKNSPGHVIYNIADKTIYSLRTIIKELLENAYGKQFNYIDIPLPIIHFMVRFGKLLGTCSNLSKQAVEYFTQSNILEIKKIENELGYNPSTNFENEKINLFNWINKAEIDQILKNPSELPWID